MEIKKSQYADLEAKKGIFFEVGLIVALGLSLAAFEWNSPLKQIIVNTPWQSVMEEVVLKNTVINDPKPAPKPVASPIIRIVENTKVISEELIINSEIKLDEIQPEYFAPVAARLDEEEPIAEETPFIIVEKMPEFPGGMNALQEFLAKIQGILKMQKKQGYRELCIYISWLKKMDVSAISKPYAELGVVAPKRQSVY